MKKVLIITYYWPPSTDSKVLRWLYFVKYLKQYNWEPTVISLFPEKNNTNDDFYAEQIPRDTEIISIHAETQIHKLKRILQKDDSNSTGINIKKAAKRILKTINNKSFNAFITDGPPHEIHFIGKKLKNQLKIPWLVDFTFGWFTEIHFSDTAQRTKTEKIKQRFESDILPLCDFIITGSNKLASQFIEIGYDRVEIITDGYDYIPVVKETDNKFTILHVGRMSNNRNPDNLWKALATLKFEDEDFSNDLRIELVGEIDRSIFKSLIHQNLIENLVYREYLEPTDAITRQFQSQVLLLIINRTLDAQGIIPNKLFEYLAAFRPILGIGPVGGDAAEIVQYSKAGRMFNYKEYRELKNQLSDWYNDYKNKELVVRSIGVKKYSRRSLTRQLVDILEKVSSQKKDYSIS